jgi:hypothetical protein
MKQYLRKKIEGQKQETKKNLLCTKPGMEIPVGAEVKYR